MLQQMCSSNSAIEFDRTTHMLKEQVRKGFAAQGIPLMLRLLPGKVKSVGRV